jgi:hypothetical protein
MNNIEPKTMIELTESALDEYTLEGMTTNDKIKYFKENKANLLLNVGGIPRS